MKMLCNTIFKKRLHLRITYVLCIQCFKLINVNNLQILGLKCNLFIYFIRTFKFINYHTVSDKYETFVYVRLVM